MGLSAGRRTRLAVHRVECINGGMNKWSLLPALCFSMILASVAQGDILIESTTVTTTGGRPGAKIQFTHKIKGKWQLSESTIDLPALPGGIQLPKGVQNQIRKNLSVRNLETGESWRVVNGIAQKDDQTAANVMGAMAKGKDKQGQGLPMIEASFKNTGKTEKVGAYDTEVWESVSATGSVTVWVAPALMNIQQIVAKGPSSETNGAEAAIRKAMAVLPGFVLKQRIITDQGKIIARSIPPGAKIPPGVANMKSQSLQEVTEVKEITFSESDFHLPSGVN